MNGQKLLNNTLRVNAVFSLISGIDFIVFDQNIMHILTGKDFGSIMPIGFALIGFASFVFVVSIMKEVNKYLVGAIILMDAIWVLGSALLIVTSAAVFTTIGLLIIASIALIIAVFASLQTFGLAKYLRNQKV